jgi:signal transduction histidine kinase
VAERIRLGSARIANFFDNCLTQDRIDSQNFGVQTAPIDVIRMLLWVTNGGAQLTTNQHFDINVSHDLPTVHGDEVLLRIALTNLLSNAFKYSPEGTTVELQVWADKEHCHFAVNDYGVGIPDEEVELIFHKYRRGRAAEGKPGAGLGLALVERIATLHGGSVHMSRREPVGSRFVLSISLLAPPTA